MPLELKPTDIVEARDVARKMEMDYNRGVKDSTDKTLDAAMDLCSRLGDPHADIKTVLTECADMISRRFSITSVAIAIWHPDKRVFKYDAVVGVDAEVVKHFASLEYTLDQAMDETTYKSYRISKMTRLYLSEDHPYAPGEEASYRLPSLLNMKRRSATDSLEADYLDIFFRSSGGQILGWIELSGTRMMKLPDTSTIRWTEMIASILGLVLQYRKT